MFGTLPISVRRRGLALRTHMRVMVVCNFVGARGLLPARDARHDVLTLREHSGVHKAQGPNMVTPTILDWLELSPILSS